VSLSDMDGNGGDFPGRTEGTGGAAMEVDRGEALTDLVRERLDCIAGLRALDPGHEDVAWWRKRTRMVLEAAVARHRGFRGALKAFDSLGFGAPVRRGGPAPDAAAWRGELNRAGNLLENLLYDLEAESPASKPTGGDAGEHARPQAEAEPGGRGNDATVPASDGSLENAVAGGEGQAGTGKPRGGFAIPEVSSEVEAALFRLAESVERDPGLSSEERHDFRLDVRSLHNEMMKCHPDAARVINLIETLSRFEVDLQPVRRSF